MYTEGSGKMITVLILAAILAIGLFYWQPAQFFFRFLWDLIVINTQPLLKQLSQHWPF